MTQAQCCPPPGYLAPGFPQCPLILAQKRPTYLRFDRWKNADFELKQDAGRSTEAQA